MKIKIAFIEYKPEEIEVCDNYKWTLKEILILFGYKVKEQADKGNEFYRKYIVNDRFFLDLLKYRIMDNCDKEFNLSQKVKDGDLYFICHDYHIDGKILK
jgi:hypothetical protein